MFSHLAFHFVSLQIGLITGWMRVIDRCFVLSAAMHRNAMALASHYYSNAFARRNTIRDRLRGTEQARPVLGQVHAPTLHIVRNPNFVPTSTHCAKQYRMLAVPLEDLSEHIDQLNTQRS